MSKCTLPVARTTSWLPTGTAIGAVDLRGFARAQAGQHDRRAAGIDRRRDPGIDAEIGRRHHALPVEGGGDALDAFAAGGKEVATARINTSARNAIGSRKASFGRGQPALSLRADISARST